MAINVISAGTKRDRYWSSILSIMVAVVSPTCAYAWDAVLAGRITLVQTSSPANYAFRVTLDNGMSVCASNMAYINTSDGNYNAVVASMLTAFSLQRSVTLYINKDGGAFCRIGDTATS